MFPGNWFPTILFFSLISLGVSAADKKSFMVTPSPAKIQVALSPKFAKEWDKKKFDHSILDAVLKKFVGEDGLVDYDALRKNPDQLNEYVYRLQNTDPAGLASDNERYIFYSNAYNALTLKGVIEVLPKNKAEWKRFSLATMKPTFWKTTKFTIGGKPIDLDHLENGILREDFDDARVHAAINCASMSCPKLQRFAYTVENMEEQMDKASADWVNDKTRNRKEGNTLYLSKIFTWYGRDFKNGPKAFVAKYWRWEEAKRKDVKPAVLKEIEAERAAIKSDKTQVEFLDYSWASNYKK